MSDGPFAAVTGTLHVVAVRCDQRIFGIGALTRQRAKRAASAPTSGNVGLLTHAGSVGATSGTRYAASTGQAAR